MVGFPSLGLDSCARRPIKNSTPPERSIDELDRMARDWQGWHPSAKLLVKSAVYNCMGLIFGSRRVQIDIDELPQILSEDVWRPIGEAELQVGDLVMYVREGKARHVAFYIRTDLVGSTIQRFVWSKCGEFGEYLHLITDVPKQYGQPDHFFRLERPCR